MENNNKIRVAITHGDTNGIGYELILKTFAEQAMLDLCTPIIYGSPKVAAYYAKMLHLQVPFSIIQKANDAQEGRINLLAAIEGEIPIETGQSTEEAGKAAITAIDRAITDYKDGLFDVLVTAPINNSNIKPEGYLFPGHTHYIETCINDGQAFDVLVNEHMRMAFVTPSIALKDVAKSITKEIMESKIEAFYNVLRRDFRISNPRIAVLSLNPLTHEDEIFGKEEEEIITPAINKMADKSIQAFGPYPASEFFGENYYEAFDGILAMYHDQGISPFKAIGKEYGVVYTSGLPLIRTASDQTVDYEKAGKDLTDPASFRHAIYLAIDGFRNRINYDAPYESPLKKLYHEHHDEGEKARFALPKRRNDIPFYKGQNSSSFPPKNDKSMYNDQRSHPDDNN